MTFSVLRETVAAEADVRVMDFCLGKPTDFPEQSNGPLDAVGRRPLAIDSSLVRPEARLPRLPD